MHGWSKASKGWEMSIEKKIEARDRGALASLIKLYERQRTAMEKANK